jgi:hypothetical protein
MSDQKENASFQFGGSSASAMIFFQPPAVVNASYVNESLEGSQRLQGYYSGSARESFRSPPNAKMLDNISTQVYTYLILNKTTC